MAGHAPEEGSIPEELRGACRVAGERFGRKAHAWPRSFQQRRWSVEHAYRNEGMKPARMLIMISPLGFERYFDAICGDRASDLPLQSATQTARTGWPLADGGHPARALAPTLVAGSLTSACLYIMGPIIGGVLAALFYDRTMATLDSVRASHTISVVGWLLGPSGVA